MRTDCLQASARTHIKIMGTHMTTIVVADRSTAVPRPMPKRVCGPAVARSSSAAAADALWSAVAATRSALHIYKPQLSRKRRLISGMMTCTSIVEVLQTFL